MLNWLLQLLKRLTRNEMLRMGLCFILIEAHSILPSPSGGFSTLLMLCSLFLRKVILLTMLAVNVFSSISKKKKQIANVIVRLRSFSYLFLNILKGITTQKDRSERLICLRQMKQKLYIGSRQNSLLPLKKLYFFVSTYLTIVQRFKSDSFSPHSRQNEIFSSGSTAPQNGQYFIDIFLLRLYSHI